MPTRTEVIQGLRARDELQNRDLALFLDYLEQVAGASSGTRDTILSSRRRIQDEITPQDFERLYNYIAELGTPADTFAAFSRVLRRRDILSRQLANFVLDEIDAAVFEAQPPEVDNISHWWSSKDLSRLWQESTRTTPVTTTGDPVGAIDNRGYAAPTSLTQSTADDRMNWVTTLTGAGGQPFIDGDGSRHFLFDEGSGLTADQPNGITIAAVWWNRTGGIKQPFGMSWALDAAPSADDTEGSRPAGGEMDIFAGRSGGWGPLQTANEYEAAVVTNDGVFARENYSAVVGENAPSPTAGFFPEIGNHWYFGASRLLSWGGALGDVIMYDKALGTASFDALVAFLETRWSITFL